MDEIILSGCPCFCLFIRLFTFVICAISTVIASKLERVILIEIVQNSFRLVNVVLLVERRNTLRYS